MDLDPLLDDADSRPAVRFDTHSSGTITVSDPVGGHQFHLEIDPEASLESHPVDPFVFPVDDAVAIETSRLVIDDYVTPFVRDVNGTPLEEITPHEPISLGDGRYVLDTGAYLKLYLIVDGPLTVRMADGRTDIELGGAQEVLIGARSNHRRPRFSIRSTDDPTDLFRAISTFATALKTQSPERSFPTLRGHPPLIVPADRLEIPEGLNPIDTGIELRVPATVDNAFRVASTAYYLGAEVVGDTPARIETTDGWTYPLDTAETLSNSLTQVLQQVFLFDGAIRTAGLYPVDLSQHNRLVERIDIDPSALYDLPPDERLKQYLSQPFDNIADIVPTWPAHARVDTEAAPIGLLSHLANELTTVEVVDAPPDADTVPADAGHGTAVAERLWFGDGTASHHTMGHLGAYRNRLGLEPKDRIRVAIVLNDPRFEREIDERIEPDPSRSSVPFDVSFHRALTTDELAALIADRIDLFHFVGHTDPAGLRCPDGHLDLADVSDNNVTYFFLNACTSYHQGVQLLETGSVAGVATVADINDRSAAWFGLTLGRLLNTGYPLHAAVDILDGETLLADRYTILGMGSGALTSHESIPFLLEMSISDAGPHEDTLTYYHSDDVGVGAMARPYRGADQRYTLIPNTTPWTGTTEEVLELFAEETAPVRIDGELYWSDEIDDLPPA